MQNLTLLGVLGTRELLLIVFPVATAVIVLVLVLNNKSKQQ